MQIEPPVGIAKRAGSDAAILPADLAGSELDTREPLAASSIEEPINEHGTADALRQIGPKVHFLGRHFIACFDNANQAATRAARGAVDQVVFRDRRRDVRWAPL